MKQKHETKIGATQERIQNPVNHLRWNFLRKQLKKLRHRHFTGFQMLLCNSLPVIERILKVREIKASPWCDEHGLKLCHVALMSLMLILKSLTSWFNCFI